MADVITEESFRDAIDLFKATPEGTRFNRIDTSKQTDRVVLLREIIGSMNESSKILFVKKYEEAWEKAKQKEGDICLNLQRELDDTGIKTKSDGETLTFVLSKKEDNPKDVDRYALIDPKMPKLLIIEAKSPEDCLNAWLEVEKFKNR